MIDTNNFIHWKELNGNKFLTKFHPAMLSEDGYALQRTVAVSRRAKSMRTVYVLFDRSYVLEVLKAQFELLEIDIDDARVLATEAMVELELERVELNE